MKSENLFSFFNSIGSLGLFYWRTTSETINHDNKAVLISSIIEQISMISFRALTSVLFAGVFIGGILSIQFATILNQYQSLGFLGGLTTSAIIREVGPLFIAFLLAGKIGAFFTAELATMRVSSQIDAIQCLGLDPFKELVLPRFYGVLFSGLLLTALGLMISVLGSSLIATAIFDINLQQYLGKISLFTSASTVVISFAKSLTYSIIIAGVSCKNGFETESQGFHGGAHVGRSVGKTAVSIHFNIIVASFIVGEILSLIWD
jgi:phospholipid/cholesterol/gamma-HCH transport system permease protein